MRFSVRKYVCIIFGRSLQIQLFIKIKRLKNQKTEVKQYLYVFWHYIVKKKKNGSIGKLLYYNEKNKALHGMLLLENNSLWLGNTLDHLIVDFFL